MSLANLITGTSILAKLINPLLVASLTLDVEATKA